MVLGPATRAIEFDAVPEATGAPFTVTVEPEYAKAGVIFMLAVLFGTLAV